MLKNRTAQRMAGPHRNTLHTLAVTTSVIVAVLEFAAGAGADAATLTWDTDGSIAGNNASTGENLGGSGVWSTAVANWWDSSLGMVRT